MRPNKRTILVCSGAGSVGWAAHRDFEEMAAEWLRTET